MGSISAIVEALSLWELIAVALAIAYLILAAREQIACWYCALASTAIYTVLFWDVQLLMESTLNVYYMAMAIYGWHQWRARERGGTALKIHTWPWRCHAIVIAAIILATIISGALLSRYSQAAWPYVDSFTTWAAVSTTYMVARKVLENWLYWFVIDAISIPLYLERGLPLTALLFAVYIVIVVIGYRHWQREYACSAYAHSAS